MYVDFCDTRLCAPLACGVRYDLPSDTRMIHTYTYANEIIVNNCIIIETPRYTQRLSRKDIAVLSRCRAWIQVARLVPGNSLALSSRDYYRCKHSVSKRPLDNAGYSTALHYYL
jgi:hypothetical protein